MALTKAYSRMIADLDVNQEGRSIFELIPTSVASAILLGTNTTDVTAYLQSAVDTGGRWVLPGPGPYPVSSPVIFTQSNTHFTGAGLPEVRLSDLDAPCFAIGAKTAVDAANRPTGIRIENIYFNQQATQVDITGSQTDWGNVDKYKTAAAIFIARTVDNGDADIWIKGCKFFNWPNAISSYPDCDDEAAGTAKGLYVEGCEFRQCNFGHWDAGFSEIFFRRNICRDTTYLQESGGGLLPPHMFYAIGRGTPWTQRNIIVIEDCWDYDNPNSNTLKIKGADEVTIRNLHTASCAEAINLLKVNKFQIDGLFHPTTPDTGIASAGAIWLSGCTKGSVRNVDLIQDDDHFLILVDTLDDTAYGTGVEGDLPCSDIDFEGVRLEIATGAVGSPVRNEGSTDIRFHQPVIVRTADVDAYCFYSDNSLGNGTWDIYEPVIIAGSGSTHGHKVASTESSCTTVLRLDHVKLKNIGRHTSGITAGDGTNTVSWLTPAGISEADADTLAVDYDDIDVTTAAGGRLTMRANSGAQGGTSSPMGFRVHDTANGSSWDTNNPWGVYEFWSADTTNGVARVRGRVGAVATGSTHGGTYITIDVDNNGTLEQALRVHPATGLRAPKAYSNTTASAANMFVDSDGDFLRSTSSARYKTDIQNVSPETSAAIISALRPIRYRSKGPKDNPDWSWYGFLAEEVAKIDPRLVLWNKDDSPDGIYYERVIPHLVAVVQRLLGQAPSDAVPQYRDNPEQAERIAALEAELEESRAPPPEALQGRFSFTPAFLREEAMDNENHVETDQRLRAEWSELQTKSVSGLTSKQQARHNYMSRHLEIRL